VVGEVDHRSADDGGVSGHKKEKPGGGNAGSDFVVIGVYGFKYAAWLLFSTLWRGESFCFCCPARFSFLLVLFSCSSVDVFNLTEPFAVTHRFLPVCALTRPVAGTSTYKQELCHKLKNVLQHKDIVEC
jgi:hypothetical protein